MADQENVEEEVQKTVTIVGYLADQDWGNWREWSDAVDGGRDYYETEQQATEQYLLRGRGFEKEISAEEYETLKNNHTGELEPVHETTESQRMRFSSTGGKRLIKNDVAKRLKESDILSQLEKGFSNKWSKENGDKVFSTYSTTKDMGLLKHPSEMDNDNPWEDEEADLMAIRFKVNIKNTDEDLAEKLNDGPVKGIINTLKDNDHIGRVRWTDCETKRVERGACYNI